MTEKFSFYNHFAHKDSTDCATTDHVHAIITGKEPWPVWVRGRNTKPDLSNYTAEIRKKRQSMIVKGYDKDQIKREFADVKKALPCVAWSSVMLPSRNAKNAVQHSGLICVDFDDLDKDKLDRLWDAVTKDKHTLFACLSPSGVGLKVVVRVSGVDAWVPSEDDIPQAELNKALRAFHAAAVRVVWKLFDSLGVEIDENCKDISRLCFLCHDSEAYYNPDAMPIDVPPEDKIERAKRLLSEKMKASPKTKPERRAAPQEHADDGEVPGWLDSALEHLKGVEMNHGEKVNVVFALSTIYKGDDVGLEAGKNFFQERTAGEQLDDKQIEDAYSKSNGSVMAGTIWKMAVDTGWKAPKKTLSESTDLTAAMLEGFPTIQTYDTFMGTEIPKPVALIEDLLYERTFNVLGAASKSGKTWFATDMGLAVSGGTEFLGRQTNPGRVLFINPEVSPYFFQQRLEQLAVANEIEARQMKDKFCVLNVRGSLLGGSVKGEGLFRTLEAIRHRMDEIGGDPFKFIVFDSFYKFLDNLDENSNSDLRIGLNLLENFLAKIGNPAALGVFHFGKGNQASRDELDRIVGGGVIGRNCDSAITITAHDKAEHYTLAVTNRNTAKAQDHVIHFDFPKWKIVEGEDPKKLRKSGTFKTIYKDGQVQSVIIGVANRKTPAEWVKALTAIGCGIAQRTLTGRIATWHEHGIIKGDGDDGYYVEEGNGSGSPLRSIRC